MPTYEYKCTECDERFEVVQSMMDDDLTELEGDDHRHLLKKVFSPVGISFKGDGFYRNDARGSSSSSGDSGGSDKAPTKVNSDGSKVESSSSSSTSTSSSSSPTDGTVPTAPKK